MTRRRQGGPWSWGPTQGTLLGVMPPLLGTSSLCSPQHRGGPADGELSACGLQHGGSLPQPACASPTRGPPAPQGRPPGACCMALTEAASGPRLLWQELGSTARAQPTVCVHHIPILETPLQSSCHCPAQSFHAATRCREENGGTLCHPPLAPSPSAIQFMLHGGMVLDKPELI